MIRRCCFLASALACVPLLVFAQGTTGNRPTAKVEPESSAGSADPKFEAVLRGLERTLRMAKSYQVKVTSRWKMKRPDGTTTGTQLVNLAVENPHKLRLEVSSDAAPQASYLVISDGSTVYKEFTGEKLYTISSAANPRKFIETDGMTLPSLHSLGIDFLLRTDLHAAVASQTIRVDDRGTRLVNNQNRQVFTILLADRQQATVTVSTGERIVPVELSVHVVVPVSDGKSYDYEVTSQLDWEFDKPLAANTFRLEPPPGGRQVADFGQSLRGEQFTATVGRAAPLLTWSTLGENPFQLASLRGKSVTVLVFWATWAAPSTDELPAIRKFVEQYSQRGVTFVLVNVGEPRELVKSFAEKAGYKSLVALDPRAESLATLGIDSVPAVVVVDKEGVVQAIQKFNPDGPPLKDRVQADLEAVFARQLRGPAIR